MKLSSAEIHSKWNRRYTVEGPAWSQRPPNQMLVDHADLLPSTGIALDAAAGVGINSVFLAQRGLHVIALDISETGLSFLKRRAYFDRLSIETAVCDLSQPSLPAECFDLIINFNFLERATFDAYRQALKPGGALVFSTFVQPTPDHPYEPFFLKPDELEMAFHDFHILYSGQGNYFHKRSGTQRFVEHLIARKLVHESE